MPSTPLQYFLVLIIIISSSITIIFDSSTNGKLEKDKLKKGHEACGIQLFPIHRKQKIS